MAVVGTAHLANPEDPAWAEELRELVNTLRFIEAKYQMSAERLVQTFLADLGERLLSGLLSAALVAI